MATTAQAHTDAVRALLAAGGIAAGDGSRPDTAGADSGYVVLYDWSSQEPASVADGSRRQIVYTVNAVCVGRGIEQARWAAQKTRDALLGVPLTVAGRSTNSPEHSGGPAIRDDAGPGGTFTITETFRYLSVT